MSKALERSKKTLTTLSVLESILNFLGYQHELILGASVASVPSLGGSKYVVAFEVPDESFIEDPLHQFPQTADESDGPATLWVFIAFAFFGDRNYMGLFPG